MDPLKMYFLLNMVIFHCYVSLLEGTTLFINHYWELVLITTWHIFWASKNPQQTTFLRRSNLDMQAVCFWGFLCWASTCWFTWCLKKPCPFFHQKLNGTESQRTLPRRLRLVELSKNPRFFRAPWTFRGSDRFGDFLVPFLSVKKLPEWWGADLDVPLEVRING